MDHGFRTETYHLKVIQVYLTQRLSSILPEIISEVTLAWQENTNIGDGSYIFTYSLGLVQRAFVLTL